MSAPTAAPPQGAQKVFISYRRQETAAHAGRLYDAMVTRFGERNVFMDVDMAPGVDFVKQITEVVSGCLVLIVVMGPEWATVEDDEGTRRLDDPTDFVRLEVETAIQRDDVVAIPALVSGAKMPRPEDLPPQLRPITRRNALELSETRWGYDVGRLFATLDEVLADGTRVALNPQPLPPEPPEPYEPPGWRLVVEAMLVAGLVSAAARAIAWQIPVTPDKHEPATSSETAAQVAGVVLRQAGTGALAGIAIVALLAYRLAKTDRPNLLLRGLLLGALAGALGGLILGLFVYLPDQNLVGSERNFSTLLSIGVTGAIFGALIGSLWRPSRTGTACLGGAVGGLLYQLIAIASDLSTKGSGVIDRNFGLAAAAIVAGALVTVLLLEGSRSSASTRQTLAGRPRS